MLTTIIGFFKKLWDVACTIGRALKRSAFQELLQIKKRMSKMTMRDAVNVVGQEAFSFFGAMSLQTARAPTLKLPKCLATAAKVITSPYEDCFTVESNGCTSISFRPVRTFLKCLTSIWNRYALGYNPASISISMDALIKEVSSNSHAMNN